MKSMVVNKHATGVLFSICSSLRARTTSVASGQRRLLPMMVFWTLARRNCMLLTGLRDTSASSSNGCTILSTKLIIKVLFIRTVHFILTKGNMLKSFAYYNVVVMSIVVLITVFSSSDKSAWKLKKDNIMFCCVVCYRNTINKRKIIPPSHPSGIMPDRMDSIGPSAHDLHRFGSQIGGLQPCCHFHLAASINADTGTLCRILNTMP